MRRWSAPIDSQNSYEGIPPETITFIRSKARQLSRLPQFGSHVQSDIEQEFVLELMERLPKFDPSKSSLTTFSHRIVKNKVASLLEHLNAEKRRCDAIARIEPSNPEDATANSISEEEIDGGTAYSHWTGQHMSVEEQEALKSDVDSAEQELTEKQQSICRLLRKHSVTETSKMLGRSRQAIYREVERVRVVFEKHGLQDYLQ